jgi:hypothetical protein
VVAGALVVGACGDDDDSDAGKSLGEKAAPGVAGARYPYPEATVREFVKACVASAGGQREVCNCTIERLQQTLPFGDFAAADRAIRAGSPVSARTRRTIDEATEACRE